MKRLLILSLTAVSFFVCSYAVLQYQFWQKTIGNDKTKERKTVCVVFEHKRSMAAMSCNRDVCLCNISYSPCEVSFICFIYLLLVSLFSAGCIKTSARHSTRHLTAAKVNRTRRADSHHITHALLPNMKNGSNRSTWFVLIFFFYYYYYFFYLNVSIVRCTHGVPG